MNLKVLVVGSSLRDKGGIVTVIKNIQSYASKTNINMELVETFITGSVLHRMAIFMRGICFFLYKAIFDRPHVVHIHMSYGGSFYRKSIIILLAKLLFLPVLLHVHGSSFREFHNGLGTFNRKYCNFILNMPDKLIVLSEEWKKYFSHLVIPEKVQVLYNGVKEVVYTISKDNKVPICLFLGRLGERKGIYDLLEAVEMLKRGEIPVKFIFAGDGEVAKLGDLVRSKHLQEYVQITGWIDNEEKESILKKADVLVLPSYNEGLPMAILEAMAYGMPIISTPVGGIPEAIEEGINGYLVQPGNVGELASALKKVILDEKLRLKMAIDNQKKVVEEFNLKDIIQELFSLYNSFMNENSTNTSGVKSIEKQNMFD